MKREALNCRKMKRLSEVLGINLNHARGIMETLWAFTAVNAPRGDIGRFSDTEIQQEVAPELKKKELVRCLVDVRLLDSVEGDARLYVHDWHEHADNAVRKKLQRSGQTFWNGCAARCYALDGGHDEASQRLAGGKTEASQRLAGGKTEASQRLAGVSPRACVPAPEPAPEPEPEPAPPPNPQTGRGVWKSNFLEALRATGKFPSLTLEALSYVIQSYPKAELETNFDQIVESAKSLPAGVVHSPDAWLRRSVSRLEVELIGKSEKKETAAKTSSAKKADLVKLPKGWEA